MDFFVHESSYVDEGAQIGSDTNIWHFCHVMKSAVIGERCNIGQNVFVASDVKIGDNVKIQNYVSVYHGLTIEDGVFVGPHVCFTNDMRPRAVNPDGSLKAADDWVLSKTLVRRGAALGANSTIRCGITIGEWAMVGSGSVVTKDVPAHGLVYGNPAQLHGFVCACGEIMEKESQNDQTVTAKCPKCSRTIQISIKDWERQK